MEKETTLELLRQLENGRGPVGCIAATLAGLVILGDEETLLGLAALAASISEAVLSNWDGHLGAAKARAVLCGEVRRDGNGD